MSIQNSKQVGDVKVMLKTGVDGNGIVSVEKTGTVGLVDTYTITFSDGNKTTFTVTNGKAISTIAKTGTSGLVDTYTITFNDSSTATFTVTNGKGITNIAKTGTVGLVDTYTITYNDGTTSTFQVTNGADTNAQIAERVENPATREYIVGEYVVFDDTLCEVTTTIANGGTFAIGTNLTATTVMTEVDKKVAWDDASKSVKKNIFDVGYTINKDNGWFGAGTNGTQPYMDVECSSLFTATIDKQTSSITFTYYNSTGYRWACKKINFKKNTLYKISCASLNNPSNVRIIGHNFGDALGTNIKTLDGLNVLVNSGNYDEWWIAFYPTYGGGYVSATNLMIRPASVEDDTFEPYIPDNTELMSWKANGILGAKNRFKFDLTSCKSLNTSGTWSGNVYTISGATFTVNDDDTITVNTNGTTSAQLLFKVGTASLDDGMPYKIVGCPSGGANNTYLMAYKKDNSTYAIDIGDGAEFTYSSNDIKTIEIYIRSGQNLTNKTFKPMIVLPSDTDSTFHQYVETNEELSKSKVDWKSNGVLGAQNIIPYPYYQNNNFTSHGVTYSYDSDGIVSASGTSDGDSTFAIFREKKGSELQHLNGMYLGGMTGGTTNKVYLTINGHTDPWPSYAKVSDGFVQISGIPNDDSLIDCSIKINSTYSMSNPVKPMIVPVPNLAFTTRVMTNAEITNPAFTEASSRANIASGETLPTIFGKIKKFFTDLKTVAFSGSYNDLSNKPFQRISINTSYNSGYPKYYKIFEFDVFSIPSNNTIPLRIVGEIGNKSQWENLTFDVAIDIHSSYGGMIDGIVGGERGAYLPNLIVTVQSTTIRVYAYMQYDGSYFKADVYADAGTVITSPSADDTYTGTIKSKLSDLLYEDLTADDVTWLDDSSTYFDKTTQQCKIFRYDSNKYMIVIDVDQKQSTGTGWQAFVRFDPINVPDEFRNKYSYYDVSGEFELMIYSGNRVYIKGTQVGHIHVSLIV